ncbi:MAG: hypothetical protein ACF8GE_12350 [Phycisphaerales bacterium JB043]
MMTNPIVMLIAMTLATGDADAPELGINRDGLVELDAQTPELVALIEQRVGPENPAKRVEQDADQHLQQMLMAIQQMNQHGPGLTLFFQVDLPDDTWPLLFEQPRDVVALDAEGNDLTDIKPDWQGELLFVNRHQQFLWMHEPQRYFTFTLTPTSRGSDSFDLTTTVPLRVSTQLRTLRVKLPVNGEVALPIDVNDPVEPVLSWGHGFENTVNIQIQPGTARQYIKKIALVSGDLRVISTGGGGGEDRWSYSFTAEFNGDVATVEVEVYTDIKVIPLEINLDDEPLP